MTIKELDNLVIKIVNNINNKRIEKVQESQYCGYIKLFYYHENFIINNKPYSIRVKGNNIYISYISITDPLMPYGRKTIKYVEDIYCKNKYDFMNTLFKYIKSSIE